MRRLLPVLALLLAWAGPAAARGILIPTEKKLLPLAMLNHHVTITIDNQVATTKVEQTFRNHTDRQLEATYLFPVPKGASVSRFTMMVNGKKVKAELLPADKARQIYTDYVRRTQDPGLLEYLGNRLFKVRVFPIPARGDQQLTLTYKGMTPREHNVVEYVYPLKTDGKATSTLEKFSINVHVKDKNLITNIYSPTHAIAVTRPGDREARIAFERDQGLLDKDFQLYYTVSTKKGDVGLTALTHRPVRDSAGYFMLLVSPRVEAARDRQIPRDMVFVLDTSGSMEGVKMEQARKALKFCLSKLHKGDRFGLLNFATTVDKYTAGLVNASADQIEQAKKWVDGLEATGGTAIDDALKEALALRSRDAGRPFTIVFFTDGEPTIGEMKPEKILKNVVAKNTANTRIFTFGVGHDVNATFLDKLAEQTRAVSTYVRPEEDIEVKVSGLYSKISNPVLTNLKLTAGEGVRLSEMYPPQLPDLFYGGQLVVLGRYKGQGHAALTLTGNVGKARKKFVYEINFPKKTGDDRAFVEDVWARRKVGYLLDQIRANGENKELVNEVVALAKRYGIATPYTSYLVVPDGPVPVVPPRPRPWPKPIVRFGDGPGNAPALINGAKKPRKVAEFARDVQKKEGDLDEHRGRFEDDRLKRMPARGGGKARAWREAKKQKEAYDKARGALARKLYKAVQSGKLGVDLSIQANNLRAQERLSRTALRRVNGRSCLEIGGVWIDEGYTAKMKVVTVRAQSKAYFRILERQPRVQEVFKLGNHLVWVTPSGTALVIDTTDGKTKMSDKAIDALFAPPK
jgi:Ca-activated chloride channel family protein